MAEVVEHFLKNLPADLAQLNDLVAKNDYRELRIAVHRLRGTCSTFHVPSLTAALKSLEEDCDNHNSHSLVSLHGNVANELVALATALQESLGLKGPSQS